MSYNLVFLESKPCIKLHLFLQDCILIMLLIWCGFHNKLMGRKCSEVKSHSVWYLYHEVLQCCGFWEYRGEEGREMYLYKALT